MPGIRSRYTMITADVVVQYASDPRALAVGFLPSLPVRRVVVSAHGGGWVAQTRTNTWRHDPTFELESASVVDQYLANGVAFYWIEYPYGWHTIATSRYSPASRFPQIPRALARCLQFLKTHRDDGLATGSTQLDLPEADASYWLRGISAGAVMALLAALEPDGWVDYGEPGRDSLRDRFSYTRNHRVGGVFAYDCATDLRRYQGSAGALPYFAPSSSLYAPTVPSSLVRGLAAFSRFSGVPQDVKLAASPLALLLERHPENLALALLISNAFSVAESSFQDSGILMSIDPNEIVGAPPPVNQPIAASGGASGVLRLAQARSDGLLLHIDANLGPADVRANWTGTLAWSGGNVPAPPPSAVFGNDAQRHFVNESQLLARWDVDNLPFPTTSEHHVNYLPAFLRERAAQLGAAHAKSRDRYFVGNAYTAAISGRTPAFGFNTLDSTEVELEMMAAPPKT